MGRAPLLVTNVEVDDRGPRLEAATSIPGRLSNTALAHTAEEKLRARLNVNQRPD